MAWTWQLLWSHTLCVLLLHQWSSFFSQTGIFLKGIEHLNGQIYSKQIYNCLLISMNLHYDANKMLWFNNMSQCLIFGGVWERESCPLCRPTCSYITQVIFVQRSVLCCPVVLLFSVLAVHRGNCSTSSLRAPLHTSFCPNSGFLFPPPRLPCLQLNLQSSVKTPHSFFTAHVHFADQISFNIKGEEVSLPRVAVVPEGKWGI